MKVTKKGDKKVIKVINAQDGDTKGEGGVTGVRWWWRCGVGSSEWDGVRWDGMGCAQGWEVVGWGGPDGVGWSCVGVDSPHK